MSHRSRHISPAVPNLNLESRMTKKEKSLKPRTPSTSNNKHKEKANSERSEHSNNHLLKGGNFAKQQNFPSGSISPSPNIVQYSASDDSALVELTVKTTSLPKQRSRSTVSSREPWGQLLKKHKNGENQSVFSNFDPLRTLHFLSKELQIHIEALLPDEKNVQEIIQAMQSALKRVPPEVASTIHLQQTIGLIPGLRSSQKSLNYETPEKPYPLSETKSTQTVPTYEREEVEKMQKLMKDSTIKLESSCTHLETLCTQLKNEKLELESQLQSEKATAQFLKKRVDDFENVNRDLSQILYKKDEEIRQLKSQIDMLEGKVQESHSTKSEIKSVIGELKVSKTSLEQDCVRLKHQLRLSAIEKEKYLAVLAVRDKQIHEIRNEMTQLQEVVNEQLLDLHNSALASMPSSVSIQGQNKENIGDGTISPIRANDNDAFEEIERLSDKSFKEFQCGDSDVNYNSNVKHFYQKQKANKIESQTNVNIREMFSELKKQAFALTGSNANM